MFTLHVWIVYAIAIIIIAGVLLTAYKDYKLWDNARKYKIQGK